MRLPFIEQLELEQRVALIAAIVRRMTDMELLVEEARNDEPVDLARRIVGTTDMDRVEQWTMVNAALSVVSRVTEQAAIITSDLLVPSVITIAESAGRIANRVRPKGRRYVMVGHVNPLPESHLHRKGGENPDQGTFTQDER